MLYDLKKHDETPSEISDGTRMAGIIRKKLKITAYEGDYLWEWVNAEAVGKIIEALKGYVRTAERKAQERSSNA